MRQRTLKESARSYNFLFESLPEAFGSLGNESNDAPPDSKKK
jgi:hypothetical protein